MADHKKHHYVPVSYLKMFAQGTQIKILSVNSGTISVDIVNNHCYKNYFYTDVDTEKAIEKIERVVAPVLSEIRKGKDPTDDDIDLLKSYTVIQVIRTLKFNSILNKNKETLINKLEDTIGGYEKLKELNTTISAKQTLYSLQTNDEGMLDDLKICMITQYSESVITSDNPVIVYNPLLNDDPIVSHTGLQETGIIIFYPLSSHNILVLYDGEVYAEDKVTQDDILKINLLTSLNANKNIIAYPDFSSECLEHIFLEYRKLKPSIKSEPIILKHSTENRYLCYSSVPKLNFNEEFDFLKLKIDRRNYKESKHYLRQRFE